MEDSDIPPPPDGSGVVPVTTQATPAVSDGTPPPPDGSGIAPGLDAAPAEQQLVQADQLNGDDTAALQQLYHTGTADQIQAFLHARGRQSDPAVVADYVSKRDAGKPVAFDPNYAGKSVEDDGSLRAAARGVAQGATLGTADEIHGFLNGVGSLLHGGSYTDEYDRTVDTDRARDGLDSQNHAIASTLGNLAGGLAVPFGLAKAGLTPTMEAVALKAGQEPVASGATADAAKVIAARAVAKRMAVEGGAYGAAYGAGTAEGGPGERLKGVAVGGAEGAAGGALLGGLGVRAAGKVTPVADTAGQDVAAAAGRQGIDVLPADVGGPAIRRFTSAAAQAPISASPIIDAAARAGDQAQAARDRIASAVGTALDPESAGNTIRQGAQSYIASSRTGVNNLYRAAEAAAGDTKVAPTNALSTLDRNIAELGETPGGAPGLPYLQGLRDELAKGDVSVPGMLRMRSVLRDQFVKDGLRGSDIERRTMQVLDSAQQDVSDGLTAAGKSDAVTAYSKANAAYKERINTIDQVLQPIIGKPDQNKSGEKIVASLTADLQGNNARAAKLLRTLPADAQADTRASIIGGLGKQGAGVQNAAGDGFSLPQFLTHWNKIGTSAKRAFFDDETRSALDDLAKVAEGTKAAQGYANRSNTSGGIWGNLGVLATGAVANPVAAGAGLGAQLVGGRLLASPRFARWLARAPRTSLSDTSYIERLGRIARAEPAIAADVTGLQQRLLSAASSSRMNVAAADKPANDVSGANGNTSDQQRQSYRPQP